MSNPNTRQEVGNPVLRCPDLDVEVVSDVIEELDDIEVVAQPKEEPDPDILVRAIVEDEFPGNGSNATESDEDKPEPNYDVEVACKLVDAAEPDVEVVFKIDDAAEPDLEVTCSITDDSNEAIGEPANG